MILPDNGLPKFVNAVARTLFVQAWASWQEEHGPGYPMGCELMEAAPETPVEAYYAAGRLISKFEEKNKKSWYLIAADARKKVRTGDDADTELGYYVAQTSLSAGVRWEDNHEPLNVEYPYFDFTYLDLDEKDYPIPEEPENA